MTKIRTWQLARTGKFGQDGAEITERDLQEVIETFTPTRPITVGHDMAHQDSAPKFGDVLHLEPQLEVDPVTKAKILIGSVKLHPSLEECYDDNLYKGWSVTIPKRAADGKRYLHSLAVCGAVPPKIPKLAELESKFSYNEGDTAEVFNFSEKIDYVEVTPMTPEEKKKMEELEAENAALKKKKAEEKEELKEKFADPQTDQMQKTIATLEERNRKQRLESFSDAISGVVPAGMAVKAKAVAERLVNAEECEFSDGKETHKKDALKIFQEILCEGYQAKPDVTRQFFTQSEFADTAKNKNDNAAEYATVAGKF